MVSWETILAVSCSGKEYNFRVQWCLLSQETEVPCLDGSAKLEGGHRQLFSARGGSAANGAAGARTRASATVLYLLVLQGV